MAKINLIGSWRMPKILGDWTRPKWEMCKILKKEPFDGPKLSKHPFLESRQKDIKKRGNEIKIKEKKIKVKMLKNQRGSPDGIEVNEYMAGEIHELPESLALIFLKEGWAMKINKSKERKKRNEKHGKV